MLVNEYFKISTEISNVFNIELRNVGMTITVPQNFKNKGTYICFLLDTIYLFDLSVKNLKIRPELSYFPLTTPIQIFIFN